MSTALLIIDPQNDFCDPKGALFVPGADEDMHRLSQYIEKNYPEIDAIYLTQDTHSMEDISHPSFWEGEDKKNIPAFTQVNASDIKSGKWRPKLAPEKALHYVEALEIQGEFPHFIWPHHCIKDSWGWEFSPRLLDTCKHWEKHSGKEIIIAHKGFYPYSEHFGIFQAQIPDEKHPDTQLNNKLLDELNQFDHLLVAGEARSHCVATSIKQILDNHKALSQKMIIIEDCMSDVPNLGHLGDPIYQSAKDAGVRFIRSND